MPGQLLFMRHERNVVPGIFGDTGKLMAYPGNVSKLRIQYEQAAIKRKTHCKKQRVINIWRRGRDLNSWYLSGTHDFQSCSLSRARKPLRDRSVSSIEALLRQAKKRLFSIFLLSGCFSEEFHRISSRIRPERRAFRRRGRGLRFWRRWPRGWRNAPCRPLRQSPYVPA